MIDFLPMTVTVSGSVAGALVAAQVAQLGFEARLLSDVSTLKTRLDYVEEDEEE